MTQTTTAPETAPAKRGFGPLPCPQCGQEATIQLDLDDLTGSEALHCPDCDNNFGAADVRAWMAKWTPVLTWMDAAPALLAVEE